MEKDLTRRQLVEEIQAQFDKKLRDAKRQKSQAEEELETASERWRNERRKLNAEIDRLESALTDAKAPSKRKTAAAGIDPEEVAKLKAAAEERFNTAQGEWQSDRTRLETQVSRLEDALVEALERSGNPIRSVQPIKDHFERQLSDAERDRIEVEQDFLRAKAQWDEEKKKLTGELIKLRRIAPSKALEVREKIERLHGRKETVEEVRIKELEEKLETANADIQKYHQTSVRAKEEAKKLNSRIAQLQAEAPAGPAKKRADSVPASDWNEEREELQHQIAQLKQAVETAKDDAQNRYESRIAEAGRERAAAEDELAANTQKWETERRRLTSQVGELETAIATSRQQLNEKAEAWKSEQSELHHQIAKLESDLSAAKSAETTVKSAQQEIEELQDQLEENSRKWNAERRQLTQQLDALRDALADAKASGEKQTGLEARLEANAERLQQELEARTAEWNDERRDLKNHIAQLQAEVEHVTQTNDSNQKHAATLQQQLDAGVAQWDTERHDFTSQIAQLEDALSEARVSEDKRLKLEERLAASSSQWEEQRQYLDSQIVQLQQALARAKDTDESAYEQWAKEREELQNEIQKLRSAIRDRDDARDNYELRLEEGERGRLRLEERLTAAAEEREAERRTLEEQIGQLQRALSDVKESHENAYRGWAVEISQLHDEIGNLHTAVREKDEASAKYELRLQESERTRTNLEQRLSAASEEREVERGNRDEQMERQLAAKTEEWETERELHRLDVEQLKEEVANANKLAAKTALEQWVREREELQDRIQELNHALVHVKDDVTRQYEPRLSDAKREISQLEDQIAASVRQADVMRNQLLDQVTQLQQEVALAKNSSGESLEQWAKGKKTGEIQKLRIAAARAKEEARLQYESRLEEAYHERTKLEEQLTGQAKQLATEKQQLENQVEQLQKQLSQGRTNDGETANEDWAVEREALQNELRQLQLSLSEGRNQDIVEQLRKQYDQTIQDMIQQKTQLSNELLAASTLLQSERERFAAEVTQGAAGRQPGDLDSTSIHAEVKRVESVLREITSLIDDPATELSMVIRKNVEKAELDAYLKGILFSLGRAKGIQA